MITQIPSDECSTHKVKLVPVQCSEHSNPINVCPECEGGKQLIEAVRAAGDRLLTDIGRAEQAERAEREPGAATFLRCDKCGHNVTELAGRQCIRCWQTAAIRTTETLQDWQDSYFKTREKAKPVTAPQTASGEKMRFDFSSALKTDIAEAAALGVKAMQEQYGFVPLTPPHLLPKRVCTKCNRVSTGPSYEDWCADCFHELRSHTNFGRVEQETAPPAPSSPEPVTIYCTFCGKPNTKVACVFTSPDANICSECVTLCVELSPGDFDEKLKQIAAGTSSLRDLQLSLPWSDHYSVDFKRDTRGHKNFEHALIHVGKALGKLFALVDEVDHRREAVELPNFTTDAAKYLADLVICALRAANTTPGKMIDLERAVETLRRSSIEFPTTSRSNDRRTGQLMILSFFASTC